MSELSTQGTTGRQMNFIHWPLSPVVKGDSTDVSAGCKYMALEKLRGGKQGRCSNEGEVLPMTPVRNHLKDTWNSSRGMTNKVQSEWEQVSYTSAHHILQTPFLTIVSFLCSNASKYLMFQYLTFAPS